MKAMDFKKIGFFVVGLVLVIAFSAFLVKKNLHDPKIFAPVMSFDSEKLEVGDVKQGPQVQGEFSFKNTGQNILVIKNVQPSCGCTGIVADEKKEYQPGEQGKIKFTFNTEGRQGKNDKTITVESNDPKNPKKTLMFSVNIITPDGSNNNSGH
jgi:hypothetical protein